MYVLFFVALLDLIGFGIVIPILPFLSPELGATELDIALIIVAYAACAGISGQFWGRLSDRYGRKPVIMLCLAGGAAGYAALGFATELWMIYAARAFAGLMAGNFGVASAMMADITRPDERAKGMGLIGAGFGLGMVLGPLLGGVLSHIQGGFMLPCLVAGLMSLLAIVAAAVLLPESLPPEKRHAHREAQAAQPAISTREMIRQCGVQGYTAHYLLHNAAVSSATYLFPLWVAELLGWTARDVGLVFGIQGIIMVLLQGGALGWLVRVAGEWRLLRVAVSLFLLGVVIAALADTMPFMVASMFIAMTGATVCMPLLNAILTQRAPAQFRGRLLGTTAAASSWGRVVGPLASGLALGVVGYHGAWALWAVVLVWYLGWIIRESAKALRQPETIEEN